MGMKMPEKITRIVENINSVWGLLVIAAFFIIFGYSLSLNVQANGLKVDKVMAIMDRQTEIMSSISESLKDKDRDHIAFSRTQQETVETQREILRLIDKISMQLDK